MAALRVSIGAVRDFLEAEIANLARFRNSLTPIETLPPELLIRVLHLTLESHSIRTRHQVLYQLLTVSSTWHNAIMGTPSFWSTVHIHLTTKSLATALERSRNNPLTIYCPEPTSRCVKVYPGGQIQLFFEAITPHIARWQSVTVGGLLYFGDVRTTLELPAPMVEYVHLRRGHEPVGLAHLNLFSGQAPRLESLTLHGVSIPWESPILSGLLYLVLTNVAYPWPSATQILRMLSKCPQLKYLEFRTDDFGDPAYDVPSQDPVFLPNLAIVILYNLPRELLCPIAERIRAPKCSHLILGTDWNTPSAGPDVVAESLINSTAHFIPPIYSQLSSNAKASFTLDGMEVEDGPDGPILEARIGGGKPHNLWLFKRFHDHFQGVPFHRIFLQLYPVDLEDQATRAALSDLDFVPYLELDQHSDNIEEFLSFLATPHIEDGVARWPFSHLRILDVHLWSGGDSLLRMLESRSGKTKTDVVEVRLPDELESLRLGKVDETTYTAIENFMGKSRLTVVDPDSDAARPGDEMGEVDDEEAW